MHLPKNTRSPGGFSLVEILVVLGIASVLVVVTCLMTAQAKEKARWLTCMGKMRQIGSAMIARGMENNDQMYTKEDLGNSNYREWRDPLSLCQLLKDYLPDENVWISPGANKRLKPYKNSYAWSLSTNIVGKRMSAVDNPQNTSLLWNNYCYTVPSVYNVSEGTSVGPKPAGKSFYSYPWNRRKAANWIYMDLHVATF